MRLLLTLFLSLAGAFLFAQNINITHRSTFTYSNQTLANIWGYAADGNEYALVGAKNGLSIVDVTDPDNPDEIIQITGPTSSWREIKTYQHYAYVVSEGGGGVQIIDLSNLPGTNLSWHSYTGNGPINGLLSNIHALHVDVTKGYLYLFGANPNPYGGRAVVLNLNADPYNPTYAGYFNSSFSGSGNYIHDAYVDNDIMYGAHVYGGFFSIVNMSNKSNPTLVTTQQTPGLFTHNTWRSGNTLFTTDEVSNSFLTSYDISNTNNIVQLDKIQSNPGGGSIVHNTYILNDYAITSWYKDGLTIVDALRPANLVQVGNYDTYPTGSGNGFNGCWGVYPYLPSGNIIASNISGASSSNGELWVLTPDYVRGCYVEGTITNGANGQPLSGVMVKLLTTSTSETSNSVGQYKMGQLQTGTFTAQVTKSGYVTQNISVSLSSGVLTTLNVTLFPVGFPVELTEFEVNADANDAVLHWATASERENAGFEVQHRPDEAFDWRVAGFVHGKGGLETPADYEFRVPGLQPGTHYFRLRQMDTDGAGTFTDVRSIQIGSKPFRVFFRPNVVKDAGELSFFTETPTSVRVEIFNAAGMPSGLSWTFDLEGESTLPVETAQLPAGMYFAVIQTAQERLVVPFLKQ